MGMSISIIIINGFILLMKTMHQLRAEFSTGSLASLVQGPLWLTSII